MASRDHALTTCGVVLWLLRRGTGFALLMLVAPVLYAVFGFRHHYGTSDYFWLRFAGQAALLLGGWLLFGPRLAGESSREASK